MLPLSMGIGKNSKLVLVLKMNDKGTINIYFENRQCYTDCFGEGINYLE